MLELLIVLGIIAILATLSVPMYTNYTVQVNRLAATQSLARLAISLENYYLQKHTYAGASLARLHFIAPLIQKNYHLSITHATVENFVIAAKPIGKQARADTLCATLSLDAKGIKKISGTGKVEECW